MTHYVECVGFLEPAGTPTAHPEGGFSPELLITGEGGAVTALLVIMLLSGPVLLLRAWHEVRVQRRLGRDGVRVTGTVVPHDRDTADDAGVYFPVVAFTDAAGQTRERRSAYSGTRRWPIGRQVPVPYLPCTPQTAVIDTRAQKTAVVGVLTVLGAALTVVPLLLLVRVL
jgi:hypothetical protein